MKEVLVHTCSVRHAEDEFEVLVYSRGDGRFLAKTFFTPQDVIINDGPSLDDVLARHAQLLPLAISSRRILRDCRPWEESSDK